MISLYVLRLIWLVSHAATAFALFTFDFKYLLYGLIVGLFFHVIGQGVSLHRYFAHRGFTVSRINEIVLIFISIPCALGSPLSWVALHRHHHKTSDTLEDLQSPHHHSILSIWLCTYLGKKPVGFKTLRDLIHDKIQIFVHNNYIYLLLLWGFIITSIGGLIGLIIFFCIPITVVFTNTMLGSIIVHKWGYRNHDTLDHSYNSFLVSILTLGDGWHNNHHANQKKYTHGERWWEFDLQAKIINWIKI